MEEGCQEEQVGKLLGKREVPGSGEKGGARQGQEGARQQGARQGWGEGMQVEGAYEGTK